MFKMLNQKSNGALFVPYLTKMISPEDYYQ